MASVSTFFIDLRAPPFGGVKPPMPGSDFRFHSKFHWTDLGGSSAGSQYLKAVDEEGIPSVTPCLPNDTLVFVLWNSEVRGLWTVKGERVTVYPKRIWHQTSCNIHQTARKWMSGLQRGGGCVDRCFLANANAQPTRVSIYLPFFLQYLHLVEYLRIPQTFRNGLPLENWGWESCTRDLFQTFWRAGRCLLFGLRFWCLWDWSLIGLVCYTSIQILHRASNFTLSALLVQFFKGKILKRFVTRL